MHNSQTFRNYIKPDVLQRLAGTVLLTAVTVSLIACGSDNSQMSNDPVTEAVPVTEDTDQLIRYAMSNIAAPLEDNYASIAAMTNSLTNSPPVAEALERIVTENSSDRQIASENTPQSRLDSSVDIESIMLLLFDNNNGASIERTGNTVIINPDENTVCRKLLADNSDDTEICTQYIQQFDMQIEATSNEAGTAVLRFQQQNVVSISYSPNSSSNALRLEGVKLALQYLMDLENEGDTMPDVMEGTIELSATTNSTSNYSQSTAALAVTETVTISDSDEDFSLNVSPSRFSFNTDSNADSIEIEIELNGLRFTEVVDAGTASETALFVATAPAFTANLQMIGDDTVKVTRLGFGKGPLRVTVDDAEMIRLTLAQFGFKIDGDTGMLTIDQSLDFDLSLDNSTGALDDELPTSFSAMFSAKAPMGTQLLEQDNEVIQVVSNGPVTVDYTINDGIENSSGNFSAAAGECFTSSDQGAEILTQVPCQ